MMLPQTGIPTDFALHRAGIGLGFAQGDLHGRVQIGHIQTGGTNSYIGIGGESNVYRIQLASIQYRPVDSVQLSAGIVEDLWVESGNHTWNYRNIEATATEQLAWMERGNVGMTGVWSSSRVVIAASMHTGEGAFRRERNAGKIRLCTPVGTCWMLDCCHSNSTVKMGRMALVVSQSPRRSSIVIKSCRTLLECWGVYSELGESWAIAPISPCSPKAGEQ